MRKIVSLLASVAILMSPQTIYAAPQPTFDWSGGPEYSHNTVEWKTLAEISEKAAYEAYFYSLPVEYKTQDGSIVLQAFPDYGKSRCNLVHEKAWDHEKMVINTVREVCDRNYGLKTPYVPNAPTVPPLPSTKFIF